jgi:aminoglycoside phosphotransferase (APT) family kinase protein
MPFYVMEFVDGHVLRDPEASVRLLDEPARFEAAIALVEVLSALHDLDPEPIGLGGLSRKDGYILRQLKTWAAQLGNGAEMSNGELSLLRETENQLRLSIPNQQRTTIVHGDYRLDNVVVSPAGRVTTVATGFPRRDEIVGLYKDRSSLDFSRFAYYQAFAAWRLAVILHGVLRRYNAGAYGEAADEGWTSLHTSIPRLAQSALRLLADDALANRR